VPNLLTGTMYCEVGVGDLRSVAAEGDRRMRNDDEDSGSRRILDDDRIISLTRIHHNDKSSSY
jgi:hypothetical protein